MFESKTFLYQNCRFWSSSWRETIMNFILTWLFWYEPGQNINAHVWHWSTETVQWSCFKKGVGDFIVILGKISLQKSHRRWIIQHKKHDWLRGISKCTWPMLFDLCFNDRGRRRTNIKTLKKGCFSRNVCNADILQGTSAFKGTEVK